VRVDITGALWAGYERLATPAGATLLAATAVVQVVAGVVNDSVVAALPADDAGPLPPPEPGPLAVDLSATALAGLALVALVGSAVLTVVTVRTFAAGDDAVAARHRRDLLGPSLHLAVGAVVLSAAVVAGLALFVVPGLFVLASFAPFVVFVAVEDRPAHRALLDAWALARGHRLELLGLGLAALLAALGVVLPLAVVVTAVAGPDSVVSGVVGAATGALTTVFGLAVLVDAYHQLTDEPATDGDDDEFEVDTDWARSNG